MSTIRETIHSIGIPPGYDNLVDAAVAALEQREAQGLNQLIDLAVSHGMPRTQVVRAVQALGGSIGVQDQGSNGRTRGGHAIPLTPGYLSAAAADIPGYLDVPTATSLREKYSTGRRPATLADVLTALSEIRQLLSRLVS